MNLHLMPKPTVAMVGGPAVGAGCRLAGACDLRVASDDAVFMAGFLPNGLSGDYGGTFFWTRIAGSAVARRLYLLNERLTAAQALAFGMVHEVVPAEALRTFTLEMAGRLTRVPRELLALVKDNLNQAEDEADRRRFLFANECENQRAAGERIRERLMQKSRQPG
jgi:2-(1,2-epoxy-1,2-dihydrophenyl)acetyl-CoA isomerase